MNKPTSLEELKQAVLMKRLGERMRAQPAAAAEAAIPVADRSRPLPLSWAQQRLWFLDQLDAAAGAAYHLPAALRLRGQLDRPALQASLARIVARHEILRTTFITIDGDPVQCIHAPHAFDLPLCDLRERPDAEAHAQALAVAEAHAPFDLSRGPLLRGRLLQLADDDHILLLTQHHIVSDGWSIGVLVRELSALYGALVQGRPDPLPPLPTHYADYTLWQRQALTPDTLQAQALYWKQQLSGAPALLSLPTDRPRPAVQRYAGDQLNWTLSPALSATVRQLCQRHGVTLFMAGLAAWSVLLSRWSGQDDLVIGIPVANRKHEALAGLIGFFVNTSALRVRLEEAPTAEGLLARIRQQLIEAHAYQDVPFEQVVEALQPPRSLSHSPVFQVMLAMNNTPGGVLDLPGLRLQMLEPATRTVQFDLLLHLQEEGEQIGCRLAYASDLFDRTTIARMARQLECVLHGMATDPAQPVDRLPLLDDQERRQLLADFSAAPETSSTSPALIHALFERQARYAPDAVALTYEDQSLTYAQLNAQANRLAHALIARGIKPDDRVALGVERGLAMVIGILGILKAGAGYVPLDPAYPATRLAYLLEDSAPVLLLTQRSLQATWTGDVPTLHVDDPAVLMAQPTHDPQVDGLAARHLAYVIYTSGSTGQPKGVMVEHAQVTRLLSTTEAMFSFGEQDVWTLFHSYAFDFSVWELWGALAHGGRLVIVPAWCVRSPKDFYTLLCREQVTVLNQTPSAFRALIAAQDAQAHRLRYVIFGGEALELHALAPWIARNDPAQTRLINMYGITETTVHVTYKALTRADIEAGRGSLVGRGLPDLRVYLLDRHGEPVSIGVPGEIHVGGAGVARGYWRRPQLTAERFLSDPFCGDPQARMYKTGDLGRWLPNGEIEYLGRNDFQVKIRGFRIELGEIEAALSKQANVCDAVVIARDDAAGDKRLVAYLTTHDAQALSIAALRDALVQELADYMLPSAFVQLEQFPLTPHGKLDWQALPAPDSQAVAMRAYAAPHGALEQAMAVIWQELLGLERVGRHDHFFELGGHSLLAVQMIARLRDQGWPASVKMVFASPSLSALAAQVGTSTAQAGDEPLVPPNLIPADATHITPAMLPLVELSQDAIERIVAGTPGGAANIQDIYPLSPLQEGMLFHHLLDTEGDAYLLRTVLAFERRERLDAFLDAMQQVIDRHDILRTAVHWQGLARPVQVVLRHAALPVEELQLQDAQAELLGYTDPDRTRLDLSRAPLMRAVVAKNPRNGEWLLALLHHHVADDNMTLKIVVQEIQAILQHRSARLPRPVPYRNFIAQLRHVPAAVHEAYFRERLGDLEEPTCLFGIVDVQMDGGGVRQAHASLDAALALALRESARRHGVSAAVLFHVAWAQLLARCTGQDDVVFGTVLAGRYQGVEAAERMLGVFINSLPLRVTLAERSVRQVVEETYGHLSTLLTHEQAPLALAQRCSGVPANVPLFNSLLNYRHSDVELPVENDPWQDIRVMQVQERTNYPVTLAVDDLGDGFDLVAQSVGSIDPARLIGYACTIMRGLVDALRTQDERPMHTVGMLDAAERHQLLHAFNDTAVPYPAEDFIHRLFEQQVRRTPDAVALVHAGQSLTYAQLNAQANRVAHALIARGVKADDRVALGVERSPAMVAGVMGILKAGAAYVPLDPSHPAERLAYLLEDSTPSWLLTQASLPATWPDRVRVLHIDDRSVLAAQPEHDPHVDGLTAQHLAYVIYTSGSTGKPKGVMVAHRSLANYAWHIAREYLGENIAGSVASLPLSFDAAATTLLAPLLVGKQVALLADDERSLPPLSARLFAPGAGWLFAITPAHLDALSYLPEAAAAGNGGGAGKAAHCIVLGGEPLRVAALRRWKGQLLPAATFVNYYGPTETTVGCSAWRLSDAAALDRLDGAIAPIGRPSGNMRIYLLDRHGEPVPMGATGEIYIGGAGVARGYWQRPQLTTERFLPDPFAGDAQARMYKSGDLGRWLPGGDIEYLGRNDSQVKIRGFRIEPGEIEALLSKQPNVRDALAVAREDVPGDKRLVAYVTSQDGQPLPMIALRDALAHALADYMLPSAFVQLERLPLTPNGKLHRQALPPPDQHAVLTRAYEAPQGELEQAMASIWQELLGLARVGRHDHFFELGGHSLLAVQMIARLCEQGWPANVKMVFASPSLSALSAHIAEHVLQAGGDSFVPANLISTTSTAITPAMLPLVKLSQDAIDRIVADTPGGIANIQDIYPLSPLQEGMLFHHLLESEGDAYLLHAALAFERRDRLDAFLGAMQQVIDRHDILRSDVHWQGLAQPVQVVHRHASLPVEELQLAGIEDAETELLARTDPRRTRLELSRAPLLRAFVASNPRSGEWLLALLHHHVIGDHVTLEIMVQEIQAILQQRGESLPKPAPYRNFIAQALRVPVSAHEAYFRERLGDIEEATCLFGIANVHGDGGGIREQHVALDGELAVRVRDGARRHGVSTAVLFHVAWAQVLACCTGQDDVVFGTVLAGRSQGIEAAERMLGLFINTLPLRIALAGRSVRQVVEETYRHLGTLLTHEQAPLALAQRCSGVAAGVPLFNSLLNYRHSRAELPADSAFWQGVRTVHAQERSNYPITLSVDDLGDGFGLVAKCMGDADPARLLAYTCAVLRGLVDALHAQDELPMHGVSPLGAAERERLLDIWNRTEAPPGAEFVLHQRFEAQAYRTPHAIAVSDGTQALSYTQLNGQANRVAHRLLALGVRPDDRVALCAERSVALVVGLLGILKAGGAYVPLDPHHPAERLRHILRDARPMAVLGDTAGCTWLDASALSCPVLDITESVRMEGADGDIDPAALGLTGTHLAYVIYTSGSTGQPKGVMVEHRHVINLALALQEQVFDECGAATISLNASVAFDASLKSLLGMMAGHQLVIVPQDVRADGAALLRFVAQAQIQILDCTPLQLDMLIADGLLTRTPPALRGLLIGGEAITPATWTALARTTALRAFNVYGPTECTVDASIARIENIQDGPTLGRPIRNTRMYVLDAHRQPVPQGAVGELYIGGAGVARGYLHRPELTAERFLADPFQADPHARMYRSGDLVRYRDDGCLVFVGRNDFQVKLRGFRIELGEIEARLAACAGVREAVVIAREDAPGDKRLVAYLTSHDGRTLSVTALREALASELADYMLPGAFVQLAQWPLTPNGKLDRRALPAPDSQALATREYEAPRGELEQTLAGIWQELLGVARVGRHDHFFELGGHSLLAVQMIARLRDQRWPASVKMIFASPSLSALAAQVAEHAAQADDDSLVPPNLIPADATHITPAMLPLVELSQDAIERIVAGTPGGAANIQDIYPLSPLQEGMLFHHLLDAEGDAYLLRAVFAFERRERLDAFLHAMQQVIDRHDVLRSAVCWQGLARPVQVVHRHAQLTVQEQSLPGVKDAETELLEQTDPRHMRLDLARAPLLHAVVASNPCNGEWLLALLHHHVISDHVTLELMAQEIQAMLMQQPGRLPRPVPYRNFIAQALRVPPSMHEAYFRARLGDIEAPTCLFGVTDVRADGSGVRELRVALDETLALRVRESARRHGVGTAVLFHVAWARVLACCTGQDDVVFGTVLAGRSQDVEAADRMLGLFINTLPLRVALAGRNVRQVVAETYRHLSALLSHEQAPLALAQRCSGVAANLPLFNTLLNYRHSRVEAPVEDGPWQGMRTVHVQEHTNYPVSMSVDDLGNGFSLAAQCMGGIDPARLIGYMDTVMHGLVDALQAHDERPMQALSMLGVAERHQAVEAFNATAVPYPADGLIHRLFERQAQAQPDAIALLHNGQSLSYGELNRRANRVAHALLGQGVGPDDRVAIGMQRGMALIVGLLGILKAGAAYVPLDPAYPAERLAYMLRDSAPSALLTQASLQACWTSCGTPMLLLDDDGVLPALPTQPSHDPDVREVTARHLAYVMYTSGSTGEPKGVMVEHRSVLRLAINNSFAPLTADDCIVHAAKIAFDAATWEVWGGLLNGVRVLLIDEATLLEPARFVRALLAGQATAMFLTTALFNQYAEVLAPILPKFRYVLFGGEAADARAVRRVLASPPQHLANVYGPTETTTFATVYPVETVSSDAVSLPIGSAIANTRVYLLDRHGEPVPLGVVGEIHIGGPGVSRGYWNRPGLTAERFVRDPFVDDPQARMYRSGDLGRRLPNGQIEYLGRNDLQVKIRGFRIELGEIEAKLVKQPGVREAVVTLREDVPGDKRLVAYVSSHDGQPLPTHALRGALAKELADYMLPGAFVQLAQLPLTPNGKLDRQALPAPDPQALVASTYEAPQGEAEQAIAAIWQALLGLARVGRHDHFFELGGHSLLAIQLIARLRERFGVEVPLRMLFSHPTLADFASAVMQPVAGMPQDITVIRSQGSKRPLFLVHPGGGEVAYAAALAPWLDADIPLYGFAARGLQEEEAPLETVCEMAQRYVCAMRRIQPEGPYRIAGYSSGGVVAYEMAYQLVGADAEVAFVGLIDTLSDYRHTEAEQALEQDEMGMLLWLVRSAPEDVRRHAALLAEHGDYEAVLRYIQQAGGVPREMEHLESAYARRILAVIQATCRAIYHYSPATLPVPVTLFSAKAEQRSDPANGWGRWMPQDRLQVVAVDGTHTSLMEDPHIRGLGDALSSVIAASEARVARYAETHYQPRIDIQTGVRGVTPLFCIPGAGASVVSFHELSQFLPPDTPIYGLQPRGLDGEMVPHADVGSMARAYLQAIKTVQPTGPYQLLGHSFGGWVAFETALRLAAAGDEVAGLYLLDSRAPREDWGGPVDRLRTLMKLVELYDMRLDRPLPLTVQHFQGLGATEQIALLHRVLVAAGLLHRMTPSSVLHGVVRVMEANLATDYLPAAVYAGRVDLISARDAQHDRQRRVEAWRLHAPSLQHHSLPGNHVTMLAGEHAAALGGWLGTQLIQRPGPRQSAAGAVALTSNP